MGNSSGISGASGISDASGISGASGVALHVPCYVAWDAPSQRERAEALAQQLGLPIIPPGHPTQQQASDQDYILWVTAEKLFLEYRHDKLKHQLSAEFLSGSMGYRLQKGGGLRQALAKAVGLKSRNQKCTVLDGTAGLGKDAFILAMLGCKMCLVERSPILFALLQDGIKRAENNEVIAEKVKSNLQIIHADFRDYLKNMPKNFSPADFPDVIYLDPMFPESRKSALTKMEMRIIRDIVGSDDDADALLLDSLKVAKKRVVVKRPLHAPYLQNMKPSFVVAGKSNRYDIYLAGGNIKIHE